MHPNAYLNTFWRLELRPQIFVAMSFADQHKDRYKHVIEPAIMSMSLNGQSLRPFIVNDLHTGDSILTDIMDGIAHSQMIVADISTVASEPSGKRHPNGNVMYEVGVALACRKSEDVLLLKGDSDRSLFDVSTIPYLNLEFSDSAKALDTLRIALEERLRSQKLMHDARVARAVASLSKEEVVILKKTIAYGVDQMWGYRESGTVDFTQLAGLPRLLDKQVIRVHGNFDEGHLSYRFTPLGLEVAKTALSGLPNCTAGPPITIK